MPTVYVVDIDVLGQARLLKAGSALLVPSDEFTIHDLTEGEFTVLFFDPNIDAGANDRDLLRLGAGVGGAEVLAPGDAFNLRPARCAPDYFRFEELPYYSPETIDRLMTVVWSSQGRVHLLDYQCGRND